MPAKDPVTGKFISASAAATAAPIEPPSGAEAPPSTDKPADKAKVKPADLDLSGAEALVQSFLDGKPTVVPEKKKAKTEKPAVEPEKEKTDAKTEPAKPGVNPKPAPAKPKHTQPPAPVPLTAEQIAAAAAEGVARVFPKPEKKDSPQDSKPDDSWLTDADRRRLTNLEQMEKMYPDKYKGLPARYRTSKKALLDYAKKWESEHPGEEFDETAEEHQQFLDSNDIDWEDEDYLEAAAEIKAAAKVAESQKTTDQKLSAIERKEKLREAQPIIYAEQTKAAQVLWKEMGEAFAGLVDENGNFNAEKAKVFVESDPVTFGVRLNAAKALDAEVAELYKLMGVPGLTDDQGKPLTTALIDFNPKNEIHVNLDKFASEQEARMRKLSAADQQDAEGRAFLPYADYYKVPEKERGKYWTFTANDLAVLRAQDLAARAQKMIAEEEEKYQKWAKARGINIETKSGTSKQGEEPEPEVETVGAVEKPASPSGGVESKLAASKSTGKAAPVSGAKAFVMRGF